MKKICFAAALLGSALLTLTAAEAPKLPGWHATAEEYTACAAAQPDTPHGVQIRRTCTLMARVVTEKPATFTAYCDLVDAVFPVTGTGVTTKIAAENTIFRVHAKACFPYLMGKWLQEGYAFAKVHKPDYLYVYQYKAGSGKPIAISDEQLYADLVAAAGTLKKTQAKIAAVMVKRILDLAPGISEITVKKDLQKLNRVYTRFFLADEANWNPIVSEIRANLAAY